MLERECLTRDRANLFSNARVMPHITRHFLTPNTALRHRLGEILFTGEEMTCRAVISAPGRIEVIPAQRSHEYTQSMIDMTTIKVSVETRDRLKRLADEDHLTLDAELARTLDKAEEARFWAGVQADYARLQADPQEWSDYVNELAEWEHTAGDGLGDE